jgi:AGZA family xanthine/uracil permease-like MFS transporter
MPNFIQTFFKFQERSTSVYTEFIAGTTTFLAMVYIVFVHPNILAVTGMDKTALISVTCIVTALTTIVTGLAANAPIAMAPGMGLNAFFAYSLVLSDKISWQAALGVVFLSGFFFFLLTLAGFRKKIAESIPRSLVSAMSVGLGIFIAFIGLVNLGIIVRNETTFVSAGPINSTVCIGLAGFLTMVILETRKIKGALIFGILVSTLMAYIMGKIALPASFVSARFDITPIAFKLDIPGALKLSYASAIFTLMFIHMFDGIGTLVACTNQAKLVDSNGNVKGLNKLLAIDALAAMGGAVLGTSTTTAFVESAAGIAQGGRTGFSSLVTAFWFCLGLLFVPLIAIVPPYATAPALIMVGFFMMAEVKNIDFHSLEEGFPAFLIMIMIALSYSISTGLAFGFIGFVLLKVIRFKFSEIKPVMWVVAVFSLLYLLFR